MLYTSSLTFQKEKITMTELEKIIYTKTFIDKLANGINPLDNSIIPENELINNIRISRCMFYVSDILRKVCENGGIEGKSTKKHRNKYPFTISNEQLSNYEYSEQPISISELARKINELTNPDLSGRLTYKGLKGWLILKGYLDQKTNDKGKERAIPTQKGEQLGISTELRNGYRGSYMVVVYNKTAQGLIISNMDSIAQFVNSGTETNEIEWTVEQDKLLIEMFQDGIVFEDVAKSLSKSVDEVKQRLKELCS